MCLHMYLYLVLTSSGFKRYRSLITSVDGITTSALFYQERNFKKMKPLKKKLNKN